jgi:hypothetical protein
MKFLARLLLIILVTAPLSAQEQTGTLEGKVSDTSGAVLPGVTVTLRGGTILGGAKTAVTDASGAYRLQTLPIGTYNVSFDLSGFQTKVYNAIHVIANTTYTLNAQLAIGQLQESVTVNGQAPILDTAATKVGFTETKELMTTIPNARDVWAMVGQAPGVATSGVNVGGTQTGNQLAFRGHGVDPRQNTYLLNGANVTDNTNNGGSQFYFDVDSFDEMQVETNSHNAEVQTPGMVLNIVPKSGSDAFRGGGSAYYGSDAIQANNIDANLRGLGVNSASNLHLYGDGGFDLGGPIVRDHAWFYGSYRYQEVQNYITGTRNPDGTSPIDRTVLWYPTGKVNWKIAKSHNFSTYFNMSQKERFERGLDALHPPSATWDQRGAPIARLFTFRDDWTASSNWLVSLKANVMNQGFELKARPGIDTATTPASEDLATGAWSNAPPYESGIGKSLREVGVTAEHTMSDRWGGQHALKFGVDMAAFRAFGNQGGGVALTTYPADHRLLFFNRSPFEVMLFQSGAQSVVDPTRWAFAEDSWRLGQWTFNVGARWDWQANSLDAVTAPKSRYFTDAVSQPATGNLINWNTFVPRLGLIYDPTGTSKTLLKASYSRYTWLLWTDKASQASVAADRTFTYAWDDANGDREFQPGESGALLSVLDPATHPVTIQSDLKPTTTDEFTTAWTQQLAANLSFSATFMYRTDRNLTWLINQQITPADYSPIVGTDPGPDGQIGTPDDGRPMTFYQLSSAKVGLSPNYLATWPGFTQEYRGFEATLFRRFANNWQLMGSLTVGQQRDNYGSGSYQNPQDINLINHTRVTDSLPYLGKLEGSYRFPKGILVSGFYQLLAGTHYTRTVNSTTALGYTLTQGNVVALTGTRDVNSYPAANDLDVRFGYDLPFMSQNRSVSLDLDIFNVLNINTITSQQILSGSAYGRVLNFIPPRILRFGVKVAF